jgi:predicted small secreted protein
MRKFQIAVFVIATLALVAAACCIGKGIGTEFRNAGIAVLLFDVVCIQLWPSAKRV